MLTIRLDSSVPIAEQIMAGIRQLIAAGRLRPGDELPTVRQLAADLGVNLNTVARGYRALEEAGLATSGRGRGTQVKASSELLRGSMDDAHARITMRVREALADVKLANLDRNGAQRLVDELINEFWPQ